MDPIPSQEAEISAKDGVRLHVRSVGPVTAAAQVLFVHGYGEHIGRYEELFGWLCREGDLCVHAVDLRGHGRSGGRPGDVLRFDDYLDDVDALAARVPAGRIRFAIGHSMGALVLARWLEERRGAVAGVVFASPYLRLAFPPPKAKVAIARAIGRVIPWLPIPNGLRSEGLTRDPEWQRATDRDPLYRAIATPRWFGESNAAQALAMERAPRIDVPSLVLVPEDDPVASPDAMRTFHEGLGSSDKRIVSYPGARHELFHELPETRRAAFAEVAGFVRSRVSSSGIAGSM